MISLDSNRYDVVIEAMHIELASEFFADAFSGVLDASYDRSPYNRPLKRSRWFYDWNPSDGETVDEGFWFFPKDLVSVDNAHFEGYQLQVRAGSAFEADEIDFLYFGYEFGQTFARSFLFRSLRCQPVLYASRLEQGSLLVELFAGAVVVGGAVATYPKFREGVLQIIGDVRFVKKALKRSLKASTELPLSERREPYVELPFQKYRQIPHETQTDRTLRSAARVNRGGWRVAKDPEDVGEM